MRNYRGFNYRAIGRSVSESDHFIPTAVAVAAAANQVSRGCEWNALSQPIWKNSFRSTQDWALVLTNRLRLRKENNVPHLLGIERQRDFPLPRVPPLLPPRSDGKYTESGFIQVLHQTVFRRRVYCAFPILKKFISLSRSISEKYFF